MSYRVSFACLPALLPACPLEALTQDSVYFGAAPLVTGYATLATSPRTRTRIEDHSTDFAHGAGAELAAYGSFSLRAEHERFMFAGGTHVMPLGLAWHRR